MKNSERRIKLELRKNQANLDVNFTLAGTIFCMIVGTIVLAFGENLSIMSHTTAATIILCFGVAFVIFLANAAMKLRTAKEALALDVLVNGTKVD